MRRILKYVLSPGTTTIETADEPRFLSIGVQGDDFVVWAEATVGTGVKSRIEVRMTGDEVPPDSSYIGTAQHSTLLMGNPFVVHVYYGG